MMPATTTIFETSLKDFP